MNQGRVGHGLRCLVEATEGPVYNLNALRSGEVDAALVQSDWQRLAYQGEGRFAAAGPFKELRAVATLHPETLTLLARPDAEIAGPADLKGKRVNYGPRGSALRNLADLVVGTTGQNSTAADGDMSPDEAVAALCEGQLDAAFFAVGHPNGAVRRAMAECGAALVPLTGPSIEKLVGERPELLATRIPASLYPGQQDEVATVGVAATLVVRADAEDAAVAELVRVLREEADDLAAQHPAFTLVDPAGLANAGRTAPLHPAAEKLYAPDPKPKS